MCVESRALDCFRRSAQGIKLPHTFPQLTTWKSHNTPSLPAGHLGEMPPPSSLPLSLRLLPPPTASLNTTESTQTVNLAHLLSDLTEAYKASSNSLTSQAAQFTSGHGFPPISTSLAF